MNDPDELAFIHTALPDDAVAARMAQALIERRLAACRDILAPVTSLYRWKGKIAREAETPMLVKTRRGLASFAMEAARPPHPCETPAFLVLPIERANAPCLAWAQAETAMD